MFYKALESRCSMGKIKTIGGSWAVDLEVSDTIKVFVNDEEVWTSTMDVDTNIAFYLKRRNKPTYAQY